MTQEMLQQKTPRESKAYATVVEPSAATASAAGPGSSSIVWRSLVSTKPRIKSSNKASRAQAQLQEILKPTKSLEDVLKEEANDYQEADHLLTSD